jgi:hypothetical protein
LGEFTEGAQFFVLLLSTVHTSAYYFDKTWSGATFLLSHLVTLLATHGFVNFYSAGVLSHHRRIGSRNEKQFDNLVNLLGVVKWL